MPAFAATGVQDATGVGPVVIGAGQVVVVQLFPDDAADAEHEATGTLVVLLLPQTICTQPLPNAAVCAVHEETGTLAVMTVLQVIVTQPLPALPVWPVQVPDWTGVTVTTVLQSVRW